VRGRTPRARAVRALPNRAIAVINIRLTRMTEIRHSAIGRTGNGKSVLEKRDAKMLTAAPQSRRFRVDTALTVRSGSCLPPPQRPQPREAEAEQRARAGLGDAAVYKTAAYNTLVVRQLYAVCL
jgi:hypothetical protein